MRKTRVVRTVNELKQQTNRKKTGHVLYNQRPISRVTLWLRLRPLFLWLHMHAVRCTTCMIDKCVRTIKCVQFGTRPRIMHMMMSPIYTHTHTLTSGRDVVWRTAAVAILCCCTAKGLHARDWIRAIRAVAMVYYPTHTMCPIVLIAL